MSGVKAAVQVYQYSREEIDDAWLDWSSLWYPDFEEAGIENCYLAFDGDWVVGFQSINIDGLCVGIEVHTDYQGQGIASQIVDASGSWKPEQNECPEFWEKMESIYG